MEIDLLLLIISASIKVIVLSCLAFYLINKWKKQEKRYLTDFPFLTGIGFLLFSITKVFDIFLYVFFTNITSIDSINNPVEFWLARSRFILCPVITIVPYFLLMLIIWFEGKKKLQYTIGISWVSISILLILTAKTYNQLLLMNALISLPPIALSIITFGIIHHKKRLPQINSILLAIGWSAFIITQIIRNSWKSIGNNLVGFNTWGFTWLGELVELSTLIIVAIGFIIPAFYSKEKIQKIGNVPNLTNQTNIKTEKKNLEKVQEIE